jgi:hypothetical protein
VQCLSPASSDKKQQLRFATASNDQKLKTWVVSVDLDKGGVDGVEVARERSEASNVADVAAMGVWRDGDGGVSGVVLAGIGMEVWKESGGV